MIELTPDEQARIARLQLLCDSQIEPGAEEVDIRGLVPRENLQAIAEAGLIGADFSPALKHALTETLCGACGSTWFVLTQHLGQCERLARHGAPHLKALVPAMCAGKHWVGVGFGHLRRPQPMVTATPVSGGWTLTGTAPWVTGWPILSGVVYGAWLPDGQHLYVYADSTPSDAQRPGPSQRLCAMSATETVEVVLDNLFVPEENFLFLSNRKVLMGGDVAGAAANVAPMLGVAKGSLRALERQIQKKPLAALIDAHAALSAELAQCRETCAAWAALGAAAGDNGVEARAWAIDLGVRAAQTSFVAASGGANALTHPAQRRCREALFYSLYQQTGDILSASATRLAQPRPIPMPPAQ
ncbi:MAG: acyl-CoA dehydrogenase family protein [Armatimonas sp.]